MIRNKFLFWIILLIVVGVGSFLRLYDLGITPPSPDWDEVALGYNAYSILQTGKDEFNEFLPVALRSFDDYKPALYAYLIIPAIILFDLSVFAVRLPSAILGIISILSVFFLFIELCGGYKYRDFIAFGTSFLFAISPWSIQFSRIAFESNIGLALNILMVLSFLKGLRRPWLLTLSAIFAGLSIYTYQSEKVFVPLLVLSLLIIYRKKLFDLQKKYIFTAILVGILVVVPMVTHIFLNEDALLRAKGTSIFNHQTQLLKMDTLKIERDKEVNDFIGLVFDNRRVTYAKTIIQGYIAHFDPVWIFVTGDISRHHAPGMGLLYLFELPFILIGIYFIIFGELDRKTKFLIFSWYLLAAIPPSITYDVPHAVRTLNFLPMYQVFAASGILASFFYLGKNGFKYFFYFLFVVIFSFNFLYFLNQYFSQLNYFDSHEWQFGYKEAVEEVSKNQHKFSRVIASDTRPMDRSYMFFLFYLKYNPLEYQRHGASVTGNFSHHHSFGKFSFRPIQWSKDMFNQNVLYVGPPEEIPDGAPIIKRIYFLDGSEAIRIAGT